jgi:hypothetical protein
MPPNRSKTSKNYVEQEGRVEAAIYAYKNGQIPSIRKSAAIFNVPLVTLCYRLHGRVTKQKTGKNQHKLTLGEEESLVKWILDLDKQGRPPRHEYVKNMANHILTICDTDPPNHVSANPLNYIGINWVYRLVNCRPELRSRFSCRYNHERAKCEDPKVIYEWFDRLVASLVQYGFDPGDIYNFDETGFAMGLIVTTRVVTSSDYYGDPKLL